jgi:signal transduction histidine kinase
VKTRVRAISYFLSIIAIAAIFFSVEHFTERFFFHDDDAVDIISAITAAVSFSECRRFFDRATDRIFFRGPRDDRAEFITNISHELQTPIAILRGNVEMLQRKSTTEMERLAAERVIVNTLDGMSRLIGDVLESAKLKFSKRIFSGSKMGVKALLWEIREDCHLLAEEKGVRFLVEAGESLYIRADRDRLKEVLLNLISNALKHTSRGGAISLLAERAGGAARIVVADSGHGIASEALPHIFERFYQIKNGSATLADKDPGEGGKVITIPSTGIGLNICKEIVEAHHGTITVESVPGKGSRFIIHLPLAPS